MEKKLQQYETDQLVQQYLDQGGEVHRANQPVVAKMPQHYAKDIHQCRLARKGK